MKTTLEFTRQEKSQRLKLDEVLEQIDRRDDFRQMINILKDHIAAKGGMIDDIHKAFQNYNERMRFWAAYMHLSEMLLKCKPFRKMTYGDAVSRVQQLLFNFEEFRIRVYNKWLLMFDEPMFSFLQCATEIKLSKTVKKFGNKNPDMTGPKVIRHICNHL